MKLNSDSASFLRSFVEHCYNQGFTEKQASALLDIYIKKDLLENSPEYAAGVKEALEKSAVNIPSWVLKGLGAATAGGLVGAASPDSWTPQQKLLAGIGAGTAAGASMAGLKNPKAVGSFFRNLIPAGASKTKNVVDAAGRVLGPKAELQLSRPFKALGDAITGISNSKTIGKGLAYGGAAGLGAYGAGSYLEAKQGPTIRKPSFLGIGSPAGGSSAPSPFSYVPQDIRTAGGAGMAAGTVNNLPAEFNTKRDRLKAIELQSAEINNKLISLRPDTRNPEQYAEYFKLKDLSKSLMKEKVFLTLDLKKNFKYLEDIQRNMHSDATRAYDVASKNVERLGNQYEFNKNMLDKADRGNWLAKIYNNIFNTQNRVQTLNEQYARNKQLLEEAQNARNLNFLQ